MKVKLTGFSLILFTLQLFFAGIIAQDVQNAELVVQTGHTDNVTSVVYSPDGKTLASGSDDNTIKLWDAATGQELKSLSGKSDEVISGAFSPDEQVTSVAFSPDGKTLASTAGFSNTIKLWDVITSRELKNLTGHTDSVKSIVFSPDGNTLASGSTDNTIKLWDVKTGKDLKTLKGHTSHIWSIAFSQDGKLLASGSWDNTIKLWDANTGRESKTLRGHAKNVNSVAFSTDGKTLVSGSDDTSIKFWDVLTGRELKSWTGHTASIDLVAWSPDGKTLASVGGSDNTVTLWDAAKGRALKTLKGHTDSVRSVVFSPDGKTLASGSWDKTVKLWDTKTALEIRTLTGHSPVVNSVALSPDGKTLVSGGEDTRVKLWALSAGWELKTLKGHIDSVRSVAFSPDGNTLASGSWDGAVKLWDTNTGRELMTLEGHFDSVTSLAFSPDGKTLASGSRDITVKLWDVDTGRELKSFEGDTLTEVISVAFSPDGKILAFETRGGTVRLWDVYSGKQLKSFDLNDPKAAGEVSRIVPALARQKNNEPVTPDGRFQINIGENDRLDLHEVKTGKLLASLIALDDDDWAVVTPEGLFDASPGARRLMHFVLELEPIALEQMKDVYYIPGLLQKIYKGEPLPKVELFSKKDLFPDVEFSNPKSGQEDLVVRLINRGGGIGQVQVLINGKEFVSDARPENFDSNTQQTTLKISLKDAPFLEGENNKIEVVARNAAGSLTNRGTPRGVEIAVIGGDAAQRPTPNIYTIVVGISDYTGDMDLSFAAKDAEDFAKAIEIGATNLLGDQSKVHVRLLTSNGPNSEVKFNISDAKAASGTKKDIQKAFADFKNATSNDVFIVYMAGHGISLNLNQNPAQAGGDTYLYLTQEATTTDKSVLSIKQTRDAMAVSSEELKELMKQNRALKQVLILDTCAAGALSSSLIAKRDLPSDQIRAIERLKDNTGFYVLMGSAADSVSYEASQYGQGLLTYSLLQGMKGAKLRENQFADVDLLFGYAQERVPQMAANIGGIQRPLIITPDKSVSFDIGKFTKLEQDQIALANPKPVFLSPTLLNQIQKRDNLGLTRLLQNELRELSFSGSTRGTPSPLVYVAVDEMTDAIAPSGLYTVEGETLTINVVLYRNDKPLGEEISVSGKVNEKVTMIKKLVAEFLKIAT